jgi:Tfp pilus assembly protein PilF
LRFGVQMAKEGLWQEALFRFERADRLDPRNPRILNNLAVAQEANGQFDAALETYRRALALAPGSRDLKDNYARFVDFYQSYRPEGSTGLPGLTDTGDSGDGGGSDRPEGSNGEGGAAS